jgi:hypothetical protein
LYIANEKYVQAESTCLRAVDVLEGSLGPENDHTAMALNNLASLYMFQGKYFEAHSLCSRALQILEKLFKVNHPNVVCVLKTMAELDRRSGDEAEVAKLVLRIEEMPNDRKVAQAPIVRSVD